MNEDGFQLRLRNFEGPFDLLLQLIQDRKLDITEVALHEVTDEFVAYTRSLSEEKGLDAVTEFLVVAATLLDLKTARLLPQGDMVDPADLELLEARDLLFARLFQYKAFKEVAQQFARWQQEAPHRVSHADEDRSDQRAADGADAADHDHHEGQDQHAVAQQVLPQALGIGQAPEEDEVGVRGGRLQTQLLQTGHDPVPLFADASDLPQQLVPVAQRRQGDGLGHRGEVVGQAHQHDGLDHGRIRGEVADPGPRQGEGLAHGAADDQLGRVLGEQRDTAGLRREFAVRLIDDHDARRGIEDPPDVLQRGDVSGGVVGRGDKDDVWLVLFDGCQRCIHVDSEAFGLRPRHGDEFRLGARGQDGVHGVAGGKAQRGATGATEGLQ